jgi:hypothetical protein
MCLRASELAESYFDSSRNVITANKIQAHWPRLVPFPDQSDWPTLIASGSTFLRAKLALRTPMAEAM